MAYSRMCGSLAIGLSLALASVASSLAGDYNPLDIAQGPVEFVDLSVRDATRQREIPLRVYLPRQSQEPAGSSSPVVLFSHGLGGNREGYAYLGQHWAARGYVAVHLQHAGSDDTVWKDVPPLKRLAAMKEAASLQNWLARVKDVPAVLDQLSQWHGQSGHRFHGRLDMQKIGMSGHSFGGQTTQALAGQQFGLLGQGVADARIKAAVVLSPSAPDRGDINDAFRKVNIPWLAMTGTHDTAAIGTQTPESRKKVFSALPPGEKYHLVLDRAEHSAFGDRPLPGDKQTRNPQHHSAILALSTAFWDAYLLNRAAAKDWLTGEGPRTLLAPNDVWEMK